MITGEVDAVVLDNGFAVHVFHRVCEPKTAAGWNTHEDYDFGLNESEFNIQPMRTGLDAVGGWFFVGGC